MTGSWLRRVVVIAAVASVLASCDHSVAPPPTGGSGLSFQVVSGDQQTGAAGTQLGQPLVVKVTKPSGEPQKDQVLNFHVTAGGGSVFAGTAITDNRGIAQELWTIGTKAGEPQRVEVRAVNTQTGEPQVFASFTANVVAGPPVRMIRLDGDSQVAVPQHTLETAIQVQLFDRYDNPTAGVPVTFSIDNGGGSVGGPDAVTNAAGIATVGGWTLGNEYYEQLKATASGSGIAGNPTVFNANALTCQCWYYNKAHLLVPRDNAETATFNGRLYVFGGQRSGGWLFSVERYDPARNTWTFMKDMPYQRTEGAAVRLGNLIYLVGGEGAGHLMHAYDPVTDTWTEKAPIPTARQNLGIAVVNGILYAIGGWTSWNQTFYSTVEAYDPATDTWTTKASMPTARYGLGVAVVNGVIYAIGGYYFTQGGGDSNHWLTTVEAYDPTTDTWTTKAPMPTARAFFGTSETNGIIYVAGGLVNGTYYSQFEAYNPATDSWSTLPSMPVPSEALGSSALQGFVYALGGWNHFYGGDLNYVWAYVP